MPNNDEFEPIAAAECSLTLSRLFRAWLQIGLTSFGGGSITQYLIQESFIYKKRWITEEEYATIIAMCQIAPGINILAYTILIGKRLAGWRGIVVSLLGLVLPSAAITIGFSAIYASVSEFARVQAALRGVFAAIFGVALATSWRNAKPIFQGSHKRGATAFFCAICILAGSAVIFIVFSPPVVVLYIVGGLCGALSYWYAAHKGQECR